MANTIAPWFDLCHRLGVGLGVATAMGGQLVDAYSEPHRHYHTLDHVQACLQLVERAPLNEGDRVAVELAVWFHDVVYDPRATDNEERSAELAERWIAEQGIEQASRVGALIRMTAGHAVDTVGSAADAATRVMHDVDLAILGAPPDDYDHYRRQIRAEYRWLDDHRYRTGRTAVLRSFLELPTIYVTPELRSTLEPQARTNITAELAALARNDL